MSALLILASLQLLTAQMKELPCFAAQCSYEVLLPSAPDTVKYTVDLDACAADADTLAPCDYIIDWTLRHDETESRGFSAYFAGHHFRFRNSRLQEYHAEESDTPFMPANTAKGVQAQAQFADLLPYYIASRLETIAADTANTVTLDTLAQNRLRVSGTIRHRGYDISEFSYIIDSEGRPLSSDITTNPGQISEQNITVSYTPSASALCDSAPDISTLTRRYPDAFGQYRSSTFSFERLPGTPLPKMAMKTTDGRRWTNNPGEPRPAILILGFITADNPSAPELMRRMESAIARIPVQCDVVWAFLDRDADLVSAIEAPHNHTVTYNADASAAACGVGRDYTPVFAIVGRDGKVRDIIVGINQDFESIVIEKTLLAQ